jgi:hypothetical protein
MTVPLRWMNDNGMLCQNWRLPEVTIDPFWKAIIVVNTRRLVSKHRYHFFSVYFHSSRAYSFPRRFLLCYLKCTTIN